MRMLCRAGSSLSPTFPSIWFPTKRSKQIVGKLPGQGASASVKEVFIRVGHERRALKIFYKDGEQYSETDDLDLV